MSIRYVGTLLSLHLVVHLYAFGEAFSLENHRALAGKVGGDAALRRERTLSSHGAMQPIGEEPKCIISEVSTSLYRIEGRIDCSLLLLLASCITLGSFLRSRRCSRFGQNKFRTAKQIPDIH